MNEIRNDTNLPPIPMSDPFKYKHYIIMKQSSRSYTLFLWTYELTGLVRTPSGSILAFLSDKQVLHTIRTYSYQTGQANWVYKSSSTSFKYSDFNDMIYNNFAFNLEHRLNASNSTNQYYECHPMPGDQVKPAVEPEIPKIPTVDKYQFKHYNIVRHKQYLEQFFLFLWEYEPDTLTTDDSEHLLSCNKKYGEPNNYRLYQYNVGHESNWTSAKTNYYLTFGTFSLVYNNYHMDWGKGSCEINPLPNDQVIPAPKFSLPEIPNIHHFQYKHYCVVQDKSCLNRYTMFLLQYEPVSFGIDNFDRIVAYQKYGQVITCQAYDFQLGQDVWTAKYRPSPYHLEDYDNFKDAVVYSNFYIFFQEQHSVINPFDNDGAPAALEAMIPSIPYLDDFCYKHYYIVQDKDRLEKYHLMLLEYEPASAEGDDKRYLQVLQKYGEKITWKSYTYAVGQDNWNDYSPGYYLNLYEDLSQTLLYHNFVIDIEGKRYQINSLPDDKVVPALKPEFPQIPNEGKQLYKHYYIVQDKNKLEQYRLYVMAYKPVRGKVNNYDELILLQNYGNEVPYKQYHYTIGEDTWNPDRYGLSYSSVIDAVIYNNFPMNLDDAYYKTTELPKDGIIPAPELDFPDLPVIVPEGEGNTFLQYMLVQNPEALELYTLYLLKKQPCTAWMKERGKIEFLDENGLTVEIRQFIYSTEVEEWNPSYQTSVSYDKLSHFIDYCSFDVLVSKSQSRNVQYAIEAAKNTIGKDGKGKKRNGWTRINGKCYYYVNGKKSQGTEGWGEKDGRTYYLDGTDNYARVENRFITIRASKYYFDDQGVMASGSGILINGTIYNFSVYGVLLSEGLENVESESYTVIDEEIKVYEHNWSGTGESSLTIGSEVKVLLPQVRRQCLFDGDFYLSCLFEGCAHWITEQALEKKTIEGSGSVPKDVLSLMNAPIDSTWGISDSTAEAWFLSTNTAVIQKYGLNSTNIGGVTAAIKAAGVSPVLFYAYTVNEGGGLGGFINHYGGNYYANNGGDTAVNAASGDAQYLANQSKIMNSTLAWYDTDWKRQGFSGPVDFVPQSVKDSGKASFANMPSGSIGRVYYTINGSGHLGSLLS